MNQEMTLTAAQAVRAIVEAIRYRWWVAILVATTAIVAGVLAGGTDASYQATAILDSAPGGTPAQLRFLGYRTPVPPSPQALLSDGTLTSLSRSLATGLTPVELRAVLSAEQPAGGTAIRLTATDERAARARALVNSWATAYVDARNSQISAAYLDLRAAVRQRLRAARRKDDAVAVRELSRQGRQLAGLRTAIGPDTAVVQAAAGSVPIDGTSVPLIVLAGLALGILVAILVALLEGRLLTADTAAVNFNLPILTVMPTLPARKAAGHQPRQEAGLRLKYHTNEAAAASPIRALVTSGGSTHDSTDAALLLARTLSESGCPTNIIRWDPVQADATIVSGNDTDNGNGNGNGLDDDVPSGEDRLEIIDRWPRVHAELERLASERVGVVVAGPGVESVGDILLAVDDSPAWFLTVQLGRTRVTDAAALRRVLRTTTRKPIGLIVYPRRRRLAGLRSVRAAAAHNGGSREQQDPEVATQ